MVADEPLPAQLDPFKIPIKIVERVMNNCYSGDGTSKREPDYVKQDDRLNIFCNSNIV
jgi:hypothetical protein